jgi:hypothetical protein
MFPYGSCTNSLCSGELPINEGIDTYHIMDILTKAEVEEPWY